MAQIKLNNVTGTIFNNDETRVVLNIGYEQLLEVAEKQQLPIRVEDFYLAIDFAHNVCLVCNKLDLNRAKLKRQESFFERTKGLCVNLAKKGR
jgi:translation elongation factor EF-4